MRTRTAEQTLWLIEVGTRLRAIRDGLGLIRSDVCARAAGYLDTQALYEIERGDRDPGLLTLAALCTALGVGLCDVVPLDSPLPPATKPVPTPEVTA